MKYILQEDKGLIEIHKICIEMDAIWRPTPCHDLGIDGQIEFLERGTHVSTGCIIAVQAKSGPSYFRCADANQVKYYAEEKHRRYWSRLNLPVILVLHNPEDNTTLYANVKSNREGLQNDVSIKINKDNKFCNTCRDALITLALDRPRPEEILNRFIDIKLDLDCGKFLSGIDFLLLFQN